jgi:TatD DNase family protein
LSTGLGEGTNEGVFDSHCHLHDARIAADAPSLIERARAAGVSRMLLAGVDPEGWRDEDRMARAHPELAVSYGVHPQIVAMISDEECEKMVAALDGAIERLARPVAVGEIGLDGMGERKRSFERQERAFREQLAVARARELPVILHVLDAQARALAILKQDGLPRAGGVVHSFSGSSEIARDFLALGLCLSFAGPVTYPNARKTKEAAKIVPRERLLVETDAPDQTPPAFRPSRNEPSFLPAIVEALAAIRGEDRADLAAFTDANARRLFGVT